MSNQGNVIFVPSPSSNCPRLTLQTGRWGGSQLHRVVAEFLQDWDGGLSDEECFLEQAFECGWLPIVHIGNEDVPTIMVDFGLKRVSIYEQGAVANVWDMNKFAAHLDELDSWYE